MHRGGKMPSRTGESASGDQLGRGRAVGKSCSRLPSGSGIFIGQGRTCLPGGRAGPGKIKGKAKGKGRAGGRGFPVKTGASSLKKLARRPCLLRQETAGDTGSHGHPKLLPLSPSSLRARAAAVPCGCGSRAEGSSLNGTGLGFRAVFLFDDGFGLDAVQQLGKGGFDVLADVTGHHQQE